MLFDPLEASARLLIADASQEKLFPLDSFPFNSLSLGDIKLFSALEMEEEGLAN